MFTRYLKAAMFVMTVMISAYSTANQASDNIRTSLQPSDSSLIQFSTTPSLQSPNQSLREYRITHWTAEDGLPQNNIKALLQTTDGYLWIGTLNGLARFDGNDFKIFDHRNTSEMLTDAIDELVENRNDNSLWIKTGDQILRYHKHRFERCSNKYGLPAKLNGPLWPGKNGRTWSSPRRGQFGLYYENSLRLKEFGEDSDAYNVIQIGEEPPHGPLVLAANGLFRYELTKDTLVRLKFPGETMYCLSFFAEPNGAIWLCSYEGIWKGDGTNWTQIIKVDPGINPWPEHIIRTRNGQLWVWLSARNNRGSKLHRLLNGCLEPFAPPEMIDYPKVNKLTEDREGNIWIGTQTGLFRLKPNSIRVYSKSDGMRDDDVIALASSPDGAIWAGTKEGLSRIKDGIVENIQKPPGTLAWGTVSTLLADNRNRVVVATKENALSYFENGQWRYDFNIPPELPNVCSIKTFLEDRLGRMWISTGDGVFCRDSTPLFLYTTNNGLSHRDVRVIFEDHHGDMWFGAFAGGLNRLHDGKITTFTTTRGPLNNRAWCIHEDEDGVFWVGSEDGLNRFVPPGTNSPGAGPSTLDNPEGRFFTFTTQQGLRDNVINNIQEDDFGYLWLSTLHGIFRVSRKELNEVVAGLHPEVHCIAYGQADGMLTSECNGGDNQPSGCKDPKGRIWFPTGRGVVMINPKEIQRNEVPPPVVIEQVIADDKIVFGDGKEKQGLRDEPRGEQPLAAVPVDARPVLRSSTAEGGHSTLSSPSLRLAPGHARVLEIHYTANTFTAPERVRFKYQLDGYDKTWRLDRNNRRVAFYTALRPGSYTFHVKACNNHGYWNETGDSFSFSIAPHFWETWPFYTGTGTVVMLFGLGLHYQRVRDLQRVQALEQQRAVVEERARIAHDLHDELGANLTGIALRLDLARTHGTVPGSLQENLAGIARATRGEVDNMREVIWAMNPQCDDTESLSNFLGQYAETFLSSAGLRCRLEFPTDPPRPLSSPARHQLFLIVKEALHNVVRHARASEVHLRIEHLDDRLKLTIADDGTGLAPGNGFPRGHGIDNMRERANALGGELTITNAPERGTVITIKLPIGTNAT